MNLINPRYPCIGIFAFCIVIHLIVALYGAVQVVWYPITYGFIMVIIYALSIGCLFQRRKIPYIIIVVIEAILLFLLFVFFILAVYMTIDQPKETLDIVYDLFLQDGNYVETYKTLSIALVICSLILLLVNTLGLLAIVYALFFTRGHEDSHNVTSPYGGNQSATPRF